MSRYAPRSRYYHSKAPYGGRDFLPTDGLDGLVINGQEVGAAHRQAVRRQLERLRERERAYAALLGLGE